MKFWRRKEIDLQEAIVRGKRRGQISREGAKNEIGVGHGCLPWCGRSHRGCARAGRAVKRECGGPRDNARGQAMSGDPTWVLLGMLAAVYAGVGLWWWRERRRQRRQAARVLRARREAAPAPRASLSAAPPPSPSIGEGVNNSAPAAWRDKDGDQPWEADGHRWRRPILQEREPRR